MGIRSAPANSVTWRIVENGERCRCGHYGCLETVTSSQAIVRSARAIARSDPHSAVTIGIAASPEDINIDVVSRAFEAGDEAHHGRSSPRSGVIWALPRPTWWAF